MFGLNKEEMRILKRLNSPRKVQDFLDELKMNFEDDGKDSFMSPRKVLETKMCHCIEGAVLAALALRINGYKPLIVDMLSLRKDFDHVIAVFQDKKTKKWGAISKTNHAVLRYRDPVYRDLRELIMSYFNEYVDEKSRKTLRSFSVPLDLSKFDSRNWAVSEKNLWCIHAALNKAKHYKLLNRSQISGLRKADKIENVFDKITEWDKGRNRKNKFIIRRI